MRTAYMKWLDELLFSDEPDSGSLTRTGAKERKRKQMEEQIKLTQEDIKEKRRRFDELNWEIKELEKKEKAVLTIQPLVRGYLVCKTQQRKRKMVEQDEMQVGKAKKGRIATI